MKKHLGFVLFFISLLALLWYFYPSPNSDKLNPIIPQEPVKTAGINTEKKPSVVLNPATQKDSKPLTCDFKAKKALMFEIRGLWLALRDSIYQDHIDIKLILIALRQTPPLLSQDLLKFSALKLASPISNDQRINDSNLLFNIYTILYKDGVNGIVTKSQNGAINLEKLVNFSLIALVDMVDHATSPQNPDQVLIDIQKLIDAGYHINNADFIFATSDRITLEQLKEWVSLGPNPESLNNKYPETPIMAAAKLGNGKKFSFWYETNYISNNASNSYLLADTLLLHSNKQQFSSNWDLLKGFNLSIADPKTAQRLLQRKGWPYTQNMITELKSIASRKTLKIALAESEQQSVNVLTSKINQINQKIQALIAPQKACFKQNIAPLNNKRDRKQWAMSQIASGLSELKIMQKLSLRNPFWVDEFRKAVNEGKYKPFIQPHTVPWIYQITAKDFKLYNLFDKEPIDNIQLNLTLNHFKGDEISLFGAMKESKLDEKTHAIIQSKITKIPPKLYQESSWITPQFLEKQNIDPDALNNNDSQSKNLFYYATKNNNVPLMEWLKERNVSMISDTLGSDPMDLVLKWNTHEKTLKALCAMNFPIQDKQRKKFNFILQEDPKEAQEILDNCPQFAP